MIYVEKDGLRFVFNEGIPQEVYDLFIEHVIERMNTDPEFRQECIDNGIVGSD